MKFHSKLSTAASRARTSPRGMRPSATNPPFRMGKRKGGAATTLCSLDDLNEFIRSLSAPFSSRSVCQRRSESFALMLVGLRRRAGYRTSCEASYPLLRISPSYLCLQRSTRRIVPTAPYASSIWARATEGSGH